MRAKHGAVISYFALLGSFFDGSDGVSAVSVGAVAHHADGRPVLLAEELERFLMLRAQAARSGRVPCPRAQLLGDLRQVPQLTVWSKFSFLGNSSALGAGEPPVRFSGASRDAVPAEAVSAVDGHWVAEIIQADGARCFFLQTLQRVALGHG